MVQIPPNCLHAINMEEATNEEQILDEPDTTKTPSMH